MNEDASPPHTLAPLVPLHLQLLASNVEDEETVAKIMASLKDVFQHATPAAAATMAKSTNMATIVGVLKLYADTPGIVADAIQIMASTARVTGAEASGVDRDGMLTIAAAQTQHKDAASVQAAVAALQVRAAFAQSGGTVVTHAPPRPLLCRSSCLPSSPRSRRRSGSCRRRCRRPSWRSSRRGRSRCGAGGGRGLAVCVAGPTPRSPPSRSQELVAPDGRTYYFDSATNTTTWEAPDQYAHLKQSMQTLSEAAAKQAEDSVAEVADSAVAAIVQTFSNHMQNGDISLNAAQALMTLAQNDVNADAIAKVGAQRWNRARGPGKVSLCSSPPSQAGGILVAIKAIRENPDNIALLRLLLMLMERISRNDLYKEQIVSAGGVDVVIDIAIARHVAVEDIALKSLSTIANLAFNSPDNIVAIMGKGGVKGCEKALQQWTKHARILENAMCALSNLMFGSDENKLQIGQTCGDEISNIIRDHPNDIGLLKMA